MRDTTTDRWEIVHDSVAAQTFVYRSIAAGACGPFTDRSPAATRADAEAEALRYNLLRAGPWRVGTDGVDTAAAEKVNP